MTRACALTTFVLSLLFGGATGCAVTPGRPSDSDAAPIARSKGLEWALLRADVPSFVWANHTEWFGVDVRNAGTTPWSDGDRDRLAYHWLDENGRLVEFEGQRTVLKQRVESGATLHRAVRMYGPPQAGRFTLELEPLRDGVSWFGPPTGGISRRFSVLALWRCSILETFTAALGLWALVVRRRLDTVAERSEQDRPRRVLHPALRRLLPDVERWLVELAWPLWALVSILLSLLAFSELSAVESYGRALWLTVSGAALPALMVALLPRRAQPWATAALSTFAALLVLADLLYLEFYGAILPVSALSLTQNLGDVRASIASLVRSRHAWLAPVPLATWTMAWMVSRPGRRAANPSPPARWLVCSALAVGALPALSAIANVRQDRLGHYVISDLHVVRSLGVMNAHLLDASRRYSATDRRRAEPGEKEGIVRWFSERAAAIAKKPADPSFGVARGMNLLLIQVESAQGWVVGATVGGRPITPFMNELRQRNRYYSRIADQTCQGMTADAEYAILNSQHPLPNESIAFLRADNHFATIAHVLLDNGYSTLSAHPFERGFWNRATLHPRYGFQHSYFRDELGTGLTVGWGLADGPLFERLVPILERSRKPFFAFVVTLSLHHPFGDFPRELAELDTHELGNQALANYVQAMHYFDRSLRELVGRLDGAGLLKDTVVAVYGDHDPRFGLDPEMLHLAGFEAKGAGIFDVLDRIPFFVVLPARATAALAALGQDEHDVDVPGGHVDVAPTLLHFLGIERPRAFLGQALLPNAGPDFAARPEGGALTRDHLFLSRGFEVPPEGGCFTLPSRSPVPLPECRGVGQAAARELEMSRRVVDLDLHETLSRLPSPRASVASGP